MEVYFNKRGWFYDRPQKHPSLPSIQGLLNTHPTTQHPDRAQAVMAGLTQEPDNAG